MEIRRSTIQDLEQILQIYEHARRFMAAHGNPHQWGDHYPERELVEQDILDKNSYLCLHDGRVAAVFYYSEEPEPDYLHIYHGSWLNDRPYGVVHRIASSGETRGAATHCLLWCLNKCGNLRIDTHEDNLPMQKMLKKNGFKPCGIIHPSDGTERIAFQREL